MIKKFISSPIDSILNKKSKNAIENKAVAEAIEQIESDIARLEGLKASLSQYGSVKLSSATDVTDSTGLALPVTEKNPSIEGSLANDIKKLVDKRVWQLVTPSVVSNTMDEDGSRKITYSVDLQGKTEGLFNIYVRSYAVGFYGTVTLMPFDAHVNLRYISNLKHEWAGEMIIARNNNSIVVRTYKDYPNPTTNYFEINTMWVR